MLQIQIYLRPSASITAGKEPSKLILLYLLIPRFRNINSIDLCPQFAGQPSTPWLSSTPREWWTARCALSTEYWNGATISDLLQRHSGTSLYKWPACWDAACTYGIIIRCRFLSLLIRHNMQDIFHFGNLCYLLAGQSTAQRCGPLVRLLQQPIPSRVPFFLPAGKLRASSELQEQSQSTLSNVVNIFSDPTIMC